MISLPLRYTTFCHQKEFNMNQLIEMYNEFITNGKTSITAKHIIDYATDNLGLANCYELEDVMFYIDLEGGL